MLRSAVALIAATLLISSARLSADQARFPEPDPPRIERLAPDILETLEAPPPPVPSPAGVVEWTYHKSSDNRHPDGNEQQMMWLMNRARSNPAQEGIWLANLNDPDVVAAVATFDVNRSILQSEFAGYAAKPPAAFDIRLYHAAKAHSDYLVGIDGQNHDGQLDRIDSAGFDYSMAAGIVFSYSFHTIYGYAAFNMDWGSGTDGTQDPPGHRYAIMSVSGDYSNVGFAVVPESDASTTVGPQVITGNFCLANPSAADHYNRFIVGTVWEDTNGNSQYDTGEGLAGVRIEPDKGEFYAVTADGGGYAIPVLTPGTYAVTFSGGELIGVFSESVAVGSDSILLDLEVFAASSEIPPPQGANVDSGGNGGGGGCLITAASDGFGWRTAGTLLLAGLLLSCLGRSRPPNQP